MQRLNEANGVVASESYVYPYMTVLHQFNKHGGHRLTIVNRGTRHGGRWTTPWEPYEEMVIFRLEGVPDYRWSAIIATTDFYGDTLPRVYRVEALERWDGGS